MHTCPVHNIACCVKGVSHPATCWAFDCTPVKLLVQVLDAEYEAQKSIAPFMKNRVLRRIVQTFTNDPMHDFGKWANNPQIIAMLTEAKRLLDEGYMTEAEMEHAMLAQLQVKS